MWPNLVPMIWAAVVLLLLTSSSNFAHVRNNGMISQLSSSQQSNNGMLSQLSSLLPDDRPISAISLIEDIDKCPTNFTVVSRTYDQDSDADLWRESGLFIKKKGRYICLSKTEGLPDCVVEGIVVINERDLPPEGYSMISRTVDSEQKAWRKKQLCYKVRHRDLCSVAVTDIIICSRIKKAPSGFTYAGEINGVTVCYKTSQVSNNNSSSSAPYANINQFANLSPTPLPPPRRPAPERPPKPNFQKSPNAVNGSIYPHIKPIADEPGDQDYEVLSPSSRPIRPTRPAPRPPNTAVGTSVYATLSGTTELDGVPFAISPLISTDVQSSTIMNNLPKVKIRSQKDLDKEYYYDFRVERQY